MYTYIHVFPQLCLLVYNPVDYRYVYHKPQHCKSWDYNVNGHDSGTEKNGGTDSIYVWPIFEA